MRETITDERLKLRCQCGAWSHQHIDGTGASVKAASDCQQFTPATDNRAEGEHSRLPFEYVHYDGRAKGFGINNLPPVSSDWRRVADIRYDDEEDRKIAEADAAFIVRACNSYYNNQQRIEQLEQVIRDQMSVLRDWRGADNVPQQVRDAMAIRLTELRRVVEGK